MDTEILKHILRRQGSVDREELECNLGGASFIAEIIDSNDKLVPCSFNGTPKVVARCRVRLCPAKECPGCGGLHLCKNALLSGECPFLQNRRGCSFSHELHSDYNMEVLREFGLETLSRTELCLLLLQSHRTLLPQICHDYNNYGCQDDCKRLHVCELYLSFDCKCHKTHDFSAPQPLNLLQKRHIPDHLIKVLKSVYANKEALRLADREDGSSNSHDITEDSPEDWSPCDSDASSCVSATQDQSSVQVAKKKRTRGGKGRKRTKQKDKIPAASAAGAELTDPGQGPDQDPNTTTDSSSTSRRGPSKDGDTICMFFIRGDCKHGDSCLKAHDMMPYRWQLRQGPFWIPLTQNETIEGDYSDPHNTISYTNPSVHFDRMKSGQNRVRQLSTVSSALKPNYSYTTHWIWYWEDEVGHWHQYTPNERGITSKELENKYVTNNNDVVTFTADSQLFDLSFRDMIERNLTYCTKRAVRRRPRFVSEDEVNKKRKCTTNITAVSNYMDKMQIAQKEPTYLLPPGAQLTTTASTINELFYYSLFPPANLAPTPQVAFTTTSEKFVGLSNFQTAKPTNAVSSANAQETAQKNTQKTKAQAALPLTTATTAASVTNSALTTTSRSQFPLTTEIQAPKPAASQFTSASATGMNLTTRASASGLKSPRETTTSATKPQMGLSISEASAFEFKSPTAAKLATSGANTASGFSTSTKSSNPLSPTLSAGKSQGTPLTSATAQSQFKSSAASTSGSKSSTAAPKSTSEIVFSTLGTISPASASTKSQLTLSDPFSPTFPVDWSPIATSASTTAKSQSKSSTGSMSGSKSSNQFSTNPDSEYPKRATTKSEFTVETATPKSPVSHHSSSTTSGLKSTNPFLTDLNPSKSLFMTSQATKSQFTNTLETTAAPKSTSEIVFSTLGTISPASASTKSQLTLSDPFSPTFPVDWSQIATSASTTAKSQSKSSTGSTSRLKSSNQISANSESEHSKLTTTSAPTKSQFASTTAAAPKSTSEITTSGTSSPASTCTKSQLTTSSGPFLSAGSSQMKSSTSATANSLRDPSTSLKTGLKSSDGSKLGVTTTKSVSKSQSAVSSTSGTNSPDAFSASSTKPELKLPATPKPPSVASSTKSRTSPDTTYAAKSQFHHSSAASRSQTRYTTFETQPEFEVETAAISYFESPASSGSPRPPPNKPKKSCIVS